MKISRLEIKDCLGIKELQIKAGKINLISGGNEKGKTSVLESIEKALYNTERRAKFVKDGEDEGTLYIEIDNGLSIDRRIKSDGAVSVKVVQAGSTIRKPESVLKSLVGEFSFNPVDFMNKKDKEQTEILLSLIPLRITVDQLLEWFGEIPIVNLDQHALDLLTYLAEKYYYDKRTLANGEVKECQSELEAIRSQLPDNYNGDDWRTVVIAELWDKVREAERINEYRSKAKELIDGLDAKEMAIENKHNLRIKEEKELLEFKIDKVKKSVEERKIELQSEIDKAKSEIVELEQKIIELKKFIEITEQSIKSIDENVVETKIEGLEREFNATVKAIEEKKEEELQAARQRVNEATEYIANNPEEDIEPLKERAEEAERMKGFIALYDNYKNLLSSLKDKNLKASDLDQKVWIARNKPIELLANIDMPVEGLGIKEGMITIDGLPIKNLSTSRQIKLALDIARATAGELKLICIDRWESLDEDQRVIFLEEIAKDEFQYFITQVTSGELKVERMG